MPDQEQLIILCPGQGAQAVGMGNAWHDQSDAARKVFAEANDVLGLDLAKLCFEGPADDLNKTDVAQAAIYTVSVACHRALIENDKIKSRPDAVAGLSLGEFTALHLAGCFGFADGLKLVRLRGQAMQDAADANPGTMVALTGDVTEEAVVALCDQARGDGVLVPANFNNPMQVVVSGSADACERVAAGADDAGFKAIPLTVAGAFHSPLMQPAADRLRKALDATEFKAPQATVIANVTAKPHGDDPATIKQLLVDQLTSPVRWTQSMQHATAEIPGRYVELAPGKVLSGLMRRIDRGTKVENHAEPN